MGELLELVRANGWSAAAGRVGSSLQRRLRDRVTARRLGAPGFRAGRGPRILGLNGMRIGEDFHAGDALWLEAVLRYAGVSFTPELMIGPHARLSDNVHIACLGRISIGAHLLCGSRVLISDHAHGRYQGAGGSDPGTPPAHRPLHSAAPVTIGQNVWLGDGVAVLAGAAIGDGCVIGANAVVTGAIPPGTIAVGAPAQPIRRWSETEQSWVKLARTGERFEPSDLVD
ncbi:MAG TPA: DapH/DapD/GlmU-related protein [Acidobacteriaceae bacterium]|nr:DapH/DapD/GlmU-related protein [Acidobacteriaceae bacterium]